MITRVKLTAGILCLLCLFALIFVSCSSDEPSPGAASPASGTASTAASTGESKTQTPGQTATPTPAPTPTPTPTPDPTYTPVPDLPASEGLAFTLNEGGGSYSFSGIGACTDTTVVVPAQYDGLPVTATAVQALKNCKTVEFVVLPEGIRSIGNYLFDGCTALRGAVIPQSAYDVGEALFLGCTSFEGNVYKGVRYAGNNENPYKVLVSAVSSDIAELQIHESAEYIQSLAFSDCNDLTEVRIPQGMSEIAQKAFYYCKKLEKVYWDADYCWQDNAFSGCTKFSQLIFGENVRYLPSFSGCRSIKSITLPEGITSISPNAFASCSGLVAIELPSTVTEICENAFLGCTKLSSINIPDSIEVVGENAFSGCTSLPVTEFGNADYLGSDENPLLILLKVHDTHVDGAVISDETRIVADGAFEGFAKLNYIDVPDSVIYLGARAFNNCQNLASVFMTDKLTVIRESTFANCTSLEYINLPKALTSVGDYAFYGCSSLTLSSLPEGLVYIGTYAFAYVTFDNLDLPAELRYLADGALSRATFNSLTVSPDNPRFSAVNGCLVDLSSKTLIYVAEGGVIPENCGIETIGSGAFYLSTARGVEIPEGVKTIERGAFSNCYNLTTITLPHSLERIESGAFPWNNAIRLVVNRTDTWLRCGDQKLGGVAQNAVAVINADGKVNYSETGFGFEYDLTEDLFLFRTDGDVPVLVNYYGTAASVTLPENYKGGDYVIGNFTGAREVTVPGSVKTISSHAFAPAYYGGEGGRGGRYASNFSVRVLHIAEGVETLEDEALASLAYVESIYIPASVTKIGTALFNSSSVLTKVEVDPENPVYFSSGNCVIEKGTGRIIAGCGASVIPTDGSVKEIAYGAFVNCGDLSKLYIPASISKIEPFSISALKMTIEVQEGSPFFVFRDGCLIDTIKHELIYAVNGAVIPDDGSVTSISRGGFIDCTNILELVLPTSVTRIGAYAFESCRHLSKVIYAGSEEDFAAIEVAHEGNDYFLNARKVFEA